MCANCDGNGNVFYADENGVTIEECLYCGPVDEADDDGDLEFEDVFGDDDDYLYEDDGQPTEYEEWQDYMGGDDWDHGQYDDYEGDYF